jgi:hypothetical protein
VIHGAGERAPIGREVFSDVRVLAKLVERTMSGGVLLGDFDFSELRDLGKNPRTCRSRT